MTFEEVLLKKEYVWRSNEILFNGVALEDVLPRIMVSENVCPSCSDLLGEETCCRTVEYDGEVHEEIPAALIRRAARKAAGIRAGDPGGL